MAREHGVDRKDVPDAKYQLINTPIYRDRDTHTIEDGAQGVPLRRARLSSWTKAYLVAIHIVIVILICLLFIHDGLDRLRIGSAQGYDPGDGQSWSPVQKHITYKTVSNAPLFTENYDKAGQPTLFSQEQDRAWTELLKPMFFAASRQELTQAGELFESGNMTEIIGFGDGSGEYIAALGVYHELHCLNKLRYHLFRHWKDDTTTTTTTGSNLHDRQTAEDSEMKKFNDKDETFQRKHLYHCIDTIKASLMCRANPAMITFQWSSEIRNKAFPKTNSRSVCADWNSVEQWSLARMVDSNNLPVNWPFPRKPGP